MSRANVREVVSRQPYDLDGNNGILFLSSKVVKYDRAALILIINVAVEVYMFQAGICIRLINREVEGGRFADGRLSFNVTV